MADTDTNGGIWCNPLSLPEIPRGKDDWYPFETEMFSHEERPAGVAGPEYRSVSDPTAFFWEGKWYLYPSYGMAWVSDDLCRWQHVRTEPYCPKYSPAVARWQGGFLLTGWACPLYYGETPLGPFRKLGDFILPDGSSYVPCDPALFTDDDGALYLYAFASEGDYGTETYRTKIVGYRLDEADPRRVKEGPVTLFEMDPENHPWERQGFHGQNTSFGWVEGPHMLKVRGRYYLIYAAPDTRDPSYCMAVYRSDSSPLSGFVCQRRNPLTRSRGGIVSGAGHGSVAADDKGNLWAFYTIAAPRVHQYERRIGIDRVAVDENGELYCPSGVTDTPQSMTGGLRRWNLTERLRPAASSCAPGRDALYATDGSNLTFWQPAPGDPFPTLTVRFDAPFYADSVRLWWAEPDYDPARGVFAGPVGYTVEGEVGGAWRTLLDRSDPDEDHNVDFRTFPAALCTAVRLMIKKMPERMRVGVTDFSVFGTREKQA